MMKTIKYLLFITVLIISNTLTAKITQLRVGDKIPNVYLKNVRSLDQNSPKYFSDFKGKLVILDFWSTWCSPCIKAIPKLDSLQKKFGNKIQILGVTDQSDSLVKTFMGKYYHSKGISPISVTEDTILNDLFPHNEMPYCVWINSEGIVVATTEENQVNEKSINEVLNNNLKNLIINDVKIANPLAPDRPIFSLNNFFIQKNNKIQEVPVDDKLVTYQSIFAKYIPGIIGNISWDKGFYRATNIEIALFYKSVFNITAYDNYTNVFYQKGRVSIEINNSDLYKRITNPTATAGLEYTKWLEKNGICYELLWENTKEWKDRFEILRQDLDRYISKPLGLTASIQKRMVTSLVLTKIGNTGLLTTKGGKPRFIADAFTLSLRNLKLSELISEFQGHVYQKSPIPFFNETGCNDPVDLEINCNLNKMEEVNQQLVKYGLKFVSQKRNADVLVISDKK